MVSDITGDRDDIARTAVGARETNAFRQDAYAAGVDVNAVGFAAFDDLGVAGHDFDAGFFSGGGHTLHDAFEVTQGEAFFQNKAAGNVERRSTANGYVVNRTVNGEASDIASRKENRGLRHASQWP